MGSRPQPHRILVETTSSNCERHCSRATLPRATCATRVRYLVRGRSDQGTTARFRTMEAIRSNGYGDSLPFPLDRELRAPSVDRALTWLIRWAVPLFGRTRAAGTLNPHLAGLAADGVSVRASL